MGWSEIVCNGPAELAAYLRPFFERDGLFPRFTAEAMPYADHFPFVAAGIPGLFLGRHNCAAGRFFHHRADDDMSRVSTRVMAEYLSATAAFLSDALDRNELPFPCHIPVEQASRVGRMWEDLFGGW